MNDYSNISLPSITPSNEVTYQQLMQGMQEQLSDKFFYLAIFMLIYVLLNMYVFKEGAKLNERFKELYNKDKYPLLGSSAGAWAYEIIEDIALMGSLMVVILHVVYRSGLNL